MPPASAKKRMNEKKLAEEKEKNEQEKVKSAISGVSVDETNSNDVVKKEDFRKYLETEGILDFVTRKLISLYKQSDKPNGDEYLKNNFNGKEAEEEKKKVQDLESDKQKMQEQLDKMKLEKVEELKKHTSELDNLSSKVEGLQKENASLKTTIEELKAENNKLQSVSKETLSIETSNTLADKGEPMEIASAVVEKAPEKEKLEEIKVSEDKKESEAVQKEDDGTKEQSPAKKQKLDEDVPAEDKGSKIDENADTPKNEEKSESKESSTDKEVKASETTEEKEEDAFVVETILDVRGEVGKREFYVKWKGYEAEDNTWEEEEGLDCKAMIAEFDMKKNVQKE